MKKSVPTLWNNREDCCGCSACFAACPQKAITFQTDDKGFLYPVIDEKECIGCMSCVKVCSYKKESKDKLEPDRQIILYGAKSKNTDILNESSSGGMFTILSDWILSEKGAVISAVYNIKLHEVGFQLYMDTHSRDAARGSKYIQATMGDIFQTGFNWLKSNPEKKLLFVGTGCQAAGFQAYAMEKKIRNRVIIVDLICHGAPSPGLWKNYAADLEKKCKDKIAKITFKDKKNGWMSPSVYADIGGQEVSIEGYSGWFYGGYSIRESCFQCPYTKIERNTDITIGDYWGVEKKYPDFFDPRGVSLLIIQSEVGHDVFEQIKDKIDFIEISEKDCLQPRLSSAAKKPDNYDKFWSDIKIKGFEYCQRKYKEKVSYSLREKIQRKVKKLFSNSK